MNKDKTKPSHAYSIITPLRMLLLQHSNTDAWKRSDQLIDHISGNAFKQNNKDVTILEYIKQFSFFYLQQKEKKTSQNGIGMRKTL